MSKMTRFFGGVVFATVLLLGAGALSPQVAQAASLTSDQISAIIGLLQSFGADQSVINNVQAALGGTTGGGTQAWCHTFNRDLTVGSTGADVSALNRALSSSGIDITGNSSSFTENTAGDVVQFQAKYGIRQTGYVGPITRAKLNKLYGCSNPIPSSTFSASPTSGSAPLAVTFRSDTPGDIDFGDGTASASLECAIGATVGASQVCSGTHIYTAPRIYNATLQVLPQCIVYEGQTDFSNCKPVTIGKVAITVTGGTAQPSVTSLQPTSGSVGTSVTITGSGFTLNKTGSSCSGYDCAPYSFPTNTINFGPATISNVQSYDGKTIYFQVPSQYMPPCPVGMGCAQVMSQVKPGTYTVSVSNANGASNTMNLTVNP